MKKIRSKFKDCSIIMWETPMMFGFSELTLDISSSLYFNLPLEIDINSPREYTKNYVNRNAKLITDIFCGIEVDTNHAFRSIKKLKDE